MYKRQVDYGHYIDLAAESNEGGIAVYRGSEKSSMVKTAVVAADILQKEIDCLLYTSHWRLFSEKTNNDPKQNGRIIGHQKRNCGLRQHVSSLLRFH